MPRRKGSRGKARKEGTNQSLQTDDSQRTRRVNAGDFFLPAILFAEAGFSPGCEQIDILLSFNRSILARSNFGSRSCT